MRIYKDITPKQQKVLKFIQNKVSQEGRPPTIREIANWFGFKSTGTVRDYLKALSLKGYIKSTARKSRALELVRKTVFRIPIITKTTTNKISHFEYEEAEGCLNLEEFLTSPNNDIFASKVIDDSLTAINLLKGDIVLIKRQYLANDGDIVAGLVENKIVIRALRKDQLKDFKVLGKVIASLRKYA